MPSFKLTIAYDGTDFHGWQKQLPPGAEPLRTVQGVVEETVSQVVREPVLVHGASRTDSGVHARSQTALVTFALDLEPRRFLRAVNSRLPRDVRIRRAEPTSPDFSPISDAIAKGYRYRLAHGGARGAPTPLFDRHVTAWTAYRLDAGRMNEAARLLIGTHDFTSFTRKHHGRESAVRTIHDCQVNEIRRHRLRIDLCGDGFLYNMVRIIAGTLVEVGRGAREPDSIPETLESRDRAAAGPTMPPHGLCLMWIRYPDHSS